MVQRRRDIITGARISKCTEDHMLLDVVMEEYDKKVHIIKEETSWETSLQNSDVLGVFKRSCEQEQMRSAAWRRSIDQLRVAQNEEQNNNSGADVYKSRTGKKRSAKRDQLGGNQLRDQLKRTKQFEHKHCGDYIVQTDLLRPVHIRYRIYRARS
ncbi:hypothetical protein F511_26259 [Dorcoceras hygrometricum]|uniref:Uncharacterized protein n=1 Tax=Dorcoceras hygrometricum TaxID=472368 RepID=A0A2Z7CUT3_9LAMI|nr:hypothetical protein F511_26259 [Dorcoceras hygrometricum]